MSLICIGGGGGGVEPENKGGQRPSGEHQIILNRSCAI